MSPIVARIRQVIPAAAAMNAHFSHISRTTVSLSRPSNFAPAKAAAIASARAERAPSRSPNCSVWMSLRWIDPTLRVERGRDGAPSAERAVAAEARIERLEMTHAVEQGQDRRVWANRRREGVHRAFEIIGLAAQHDGVEGRIQRPRQHKRRGGQRRIAEATADRQPGAGEFRRAPRADEERHVAAGLQQPAAEVAADRAGADNEKAHGRLLLGKRPLSLRLGRRAEATYPRRRLRPRREVVAGRPPAIARAAEAIAPRLGSAMVRPIPLDRSLPMSALSAFPITRRWPAQHPERLQLYSLPTPNGVKVSIMLEEIGLPYEPHRVDIGKNESWTPEFLSLEPERQDSRRSSIPTGRAASRSALFESGAILLYLAEKSGKLAARRCRGAL